MSTRRGILTVLRDISSYVGGWLLLAKQAGIWFDPPDQSNETLIWVAALLIGVPGVAQIITLRYGGSTGAPSSQPAGPAPQQPSSSPSGTSGGK